MKELFFVFTKLSDVLEHKMSRLRYLLCALLYFVVTSVIHGNQIQGLNFDIFNSLNGVWGSRIDDSREDHYGWGSDGSHGYGVIIDFGRREIIFAGLSYRFTIESVAATSNDIVEFTGYFVVYDARIEQIIKSPATFHIELLPDGQMNFIENTAGKHNFQLRTGDRPKTRTLAVSTTGIRLIFEQSQNSYVLEKKDKIVTGTDINPGERGYLLYEADVAEDLDGYVLSDSGTIGWIKFDWDDIEYGVANDSRIRIRENPTLQSSNLGYLESEQRVRILKKSEEPMQIGEMYSYWYQIETQDGITGWSYGWFIDLVID